MTDENSGYVPAELMKTVARHNLEVLQAVMRTAGLQDLHIFYDSGDGKKTVENAVQDGRDPSQAEVFNLDVEGLQTAEPCPEGNDEEEDGWWRVPVAAMPFADAVRTVCFDVLSACDRDWAAEEGTAGSVRVGLESADIERHRRVIELESFKETMVPQAAVLEDVESINSDGWDGWWQAEIDRENFAAILACMAEAGLREISVQLRRMPDGGGFAESVGSEPPVDAEDWSMVEQRVAGEAVESWTERQPLREAVLCVVRDEIWREFPGWLSGQGAFTAKATVTSEGVRLNVERRKVERSVVLVRAPAPRAGIVAHEGSLPAGAPATVGLGMYP